MLTCRLKMQQQQLQIKDTAPLLTLLLLPPVLSFQCHSTEYYTNRHHQSLWRFNCCGSTQLDSSLLTRAISWIVHKLTLIFLISIRLGTISTTTGDNLIHSDHLPRPGHIPSNPLHLWQQYNDPLRPRNVAPHHQPEEIKRFNQCVSSRFSGVNLITFIRWDIKKLKIHDIEVILLSFSTCPIYVHSWPYATTYFVILILILQSLKALLWLLDEMLLTLEFVHRKITDDTLMFHLPV